MYNSLKFLTKPKVGYINRVSNDYFCFKWSINNIFQYSQLSEMTILQSPEFSTGTNNGNVWILKLIINHNFFQIDLQLHLISYKDQSDFIIYFCLLDKENKKIDQIQKSINIDKCLEGEMVCEVNNFMRDNRHYNNKIPVNKCTFLCEMIHSSPKVMKIIKHSKSNDLKLFLRNEKLSDVIVSVGKTKFHLHKAILASRSEVFLAMFEHNTKESTENLVEITDVDEKIMKKIILYIYTDEIENFEEDACDIFIVADKYGMEGLKSLCIEELSNFLTLDNAFEILILADTYNAKSLEINVLHFIASNLPQLIGKPGYKKLRNKYPHLIENILLAVACIM